MAFMNDMLPLIIIIAIFVCGGLLALLGYGVFRYRQEAIEAALRQELLRRGMSVDDIVRVLKASRPLDMHIRSVELANEAVLKGNELKLHAELKQAELKLKQEMVERGMSADDIVRVLKASVTVEVQERRAEPVPIDQGGHSEFLAKK